MIRKDTETACVKFNEKQSKSFDIKAGHKALAYESKVTFISAFYDNQEESGLKIEDTEEELNREF